MARVRSQKTSPPVDLTVDSAIEDVECKELSKEEIAAAQRQLKSRSIKPASVGDDAGFKPPWVQDCGHFSYWLGKDGYCNGCPHEVEEKRSGTVTRRTVAYLAYPGAKQLRDTLNRTFSELQKIPKRQLTDEQEAELADLTEWRQKCDAVKRR